MTKKKKRRLKSLTSEIKGRALLPIIHFGTEIKRSIRGYSELYATKLDKLDAMEKVLETQKLLRPNLAGRRGSRL